MRGRVRIEPVRAAPKARIRVAARARERDAEELFEVAAGEEGPVERVELRDGVGEGEEPPGASGHRRDRSTRGGRWGWED